MAVKRFPLLLYLIVGVVMDAVMSMSDNSAPNLNYSKRLKQGHDVITMMQRTVGRENMWRQSLSSCKKEQQTHT